MPASRASSAWNSVFTATKRPVSPASTAASPSWQISRSLASSPSVAADRRQPGGLDLKQLTHVEQLVHFLVGGHVHERPLVGPQVNPPLRLQPVQRLPDRLAAHPELAGELGLHQVLAGPQPALHHQFHQRLIDRLPQRHRPLHRADRPGLIGFPDVRCHADLPPRTFSI